MHSILLDAVLGQARAGAADRAQVEAAVFGAGLAHLGAAVALGEHDQRSALGLEEKGAKRGPSPIFHLMSY